MMTKRIRQAQSRLWLLLLIGGGLVIGAPRSALADAASGDAAALMQSGKMIYEAQCASCHGENGEGGSHEYQDPLIGDLSLASLTRKIERTMPEDDEGACVGEDAAAVGRYIYDTFYSPQARAAQLATLKPDLQRLTVPQHRRTVADLVGSFRSGHDKTYTEKRGLSMRVNGRHPTEKDNDKKKWVDHRETASEVFYEIADKSPYDDIDRGERIEITWDGSVLAERTGEYEFVIRSRNGFDFWFNEPNWRRTPQVDGSVVSGNDVREIKYSAFLIGGWAYPIRLKWMLSEKEKAGSVQLLWKPPGGVTERIPMRSMMPQETPKVAVISTPFPPDDASLGYERGTAVSRAWQEATVRAAIEAANLVVDDLDDLAGIQSANDPEREAKIRKFCERFVARALRRPLDDDAKKRFVDKPFAGAPNTDAAVKRVVLMTLCSAEFLYPQAGVDKPDDYDIAARLALALWDALPDAELTKAAEHGQLHAREQIAQQAQRMLADRRARTKLHGFFHHWLELDRAENVSKDEQVFPEFDHALMNDLRVSLEMFLDQVVWSEQSDYRQLLLADYLYVNGRLRKLYAPQASDAEVKGGGEFARVKVDPARRSGVITHPYLLTAFAYHNATSPIHRGVFLTRNIVGRQLKPPPKAISFSNTKFDPSLTMRQKVTQLTRDSACMSCHATINPLGFSLEHYDGIGRWRTIDNDKPINAASDFAGDDGGTVTLRGARDVAEFAVQSSAAQRAFVRQMFHHVAKQDTSAYGVTVLDDLEESFIDSGYNIRRLVAEIATIDAAYGLNTK
jgi:mono/diheme cytochrome c family protein